MGTIIEVTENNVYIKKEAVYYKISKELFTFKPQVDMEIKILSGSEGKIFKIILLKKQESVNQKSKPFKYLRVSSFYSIILGLILFIIVNGKTHIREEYFFSILLISVFVLISGILMNAFKSHKKKIFTAAISFIFYILSLISGIFLLTTTRVCSGFTLCAISIIPIMFYLLFFCNLKKNKEKTFKTFPYL